MNLIIPYLLLALSAILWGANFNLAGILLDEMQPFVAAAYRFIIAAGLMLLLVLLKGERVPLRYWRSYVILGMVGIFSFNLFFFIGMQSTTAVNGALIMGLNPLLTSVLAYFVLKKVPSRFQLMAFPVGLIGVSVVILGGGVHVEVSHGDWFLLAACIAWAGYNVLALTHMPEDVSSFANTAGIMVVGASSLTAIALLTGQHFIIPSPHAVAVLGVMSVLGGVLAYVFWNMGIAKAGATQAAIFVNLVPVTSMVISALQGDTPTPAHLLGGVLVIGAVSFASFAEYQSLKKTGT
jgi:drug/metabolite transporter (DMT)-like permease